MTSHPTVRHHGRRCRDPVPTRPSMVRPSISQLHPVPGPSRGVLTKIRPFEYFEWLGKQQESVKKTGIEPFYDSKSIFYWL